MNKYVLSVYLFKILIFSNLCSAYESVNVKLNQGELSGKVKKTFYKNKEYYVFKGIPFAEPPVDKLRFKPPVLHSGWENIYEAYDNKPTCFQFNTRLRLESNYGMSGSEDCLYINVFTPNLKSSAPVIVFDHNENFKTSFNGSDVYSPDFFMEEDTIVVTISYRLMVLGYLTTEDDIVPPNAGLQDYIMGLKWVKENIKHFGGDPSRVTLMGSRNGASLGEILLYSKKAENLFSGIIMQSGTALEPALFCQNARAKAFELGTTLNITTDSSLVLLEELQKLDIETVYKNLLEMNLTDEGDHSQHMFSFSPIIENDHSEAIITSLPENAKVINNVPIIIGMNSREGLDLISPYLIQLELLNEVSNDFVFLFPIRTNYKFDIKSSIYKNATNEIIQFYFEEGYIYYKNVLDYSVYAGDILQNYALNLAAKQLSKKTKSQVYYYVFDFRGHLNENSDYIQKSTSVSIQPWGATIVDELCYLFVCARIEKKYTELLNLVSEQPEMKVLQKMVRLWTNFAKTGNPTPSKEDDILKNFVWNPINKETNDTEYLHITKHLLMKKNPLDKRERFWNGFLTKYGELAVDGVVQNVEDDPKHDEL